MGPIYYGAWVCRAYDGTFVAELPDFPDVSASGQSMARVFALASVRLAARIASLRREGRPLPPATNASALLDGCIQHRAVAHIWISAADA
jgi:predicted RNase H-like HicB family nuclease